MAASLQTTGGLWERLEQQAAQPNLPETPLYQTLQERLDVSLYRPKAVDNVIEQEFTGKEGAYYVLKSPAGEYIKMTPAEHLLWTKMDGQTSARQLMVAYLMETGSFDLGRISFLLMNLRAKGFLTDKPVQIYRPVNQKLNRGWFSYFGEFMRQLFLQREFAVQGLDGILSWLYRAGVWVFFTWPMKLLLTLLAVVGTAAFVVDMHSHQILNRGEVLFHADRLGVNLLLFIVVYFITMLLHELAHAFTVKSYGREVRRGGFLIYYGMPGFFVETTDIWLAPRRARIAVSWAGPLMTLAIGGACALAVWFWPDSTLVNLWMELAFLSYLFGVFNLNPLLALDGYFILMDWLEIPNLRLRAFLFMRSTFWEKLRKRERFTRQDWIFTGFGVLATVYSAYAIFLVLSILQSTVFGLAESVWISNSWTSKIFLGLALVLTVVPMGLGLVAMFQRYLRMIVRTRWMRAFFSREGQIALALWAGVAAVSLWNLFGGFSFVQLALLQVGAVLIGCAMAYRARHAPLLAGHRLTLILLTVPLLSLLLGSVTQPQNGAQPCLGDVVAVGALLLMTGVLLRQSALKQLRHYQAALMLLVLFAGGGLGIVAVLTLPNSSLVLGGSLGILALGVLIPTLIQSTGTKFFWSWWSLAAAVATLTIALILPPSLLPVLPVRAFGSIHLLITGGLNVTLLLFALAAQRVAFASSARQEKEQATDVDALYQSTRQLIKALLTHYRHNVGAAQTTHLLKRLNVQLALLQHPWQLDEDGVPGCSSAEQATLLEVASACQQLLYQVLPLVERLAGRGFLRRSLTVAYESLPWTERELLSDYVLKDMPWATWLLRGESAPPADTLEILRQAPIFSTCSETELRLLARHFQTRAYPAGATIIRQGQRAGTFYLVKRGIVLVRQRSARGGIEQVVNEHGPGSAFGELALLQHTRRNASCVAATPVEVLVLSRKAFNRLARHQLDLGDRLSNALAPLQALHRLPIFAQLPARRLRELREALTTISYAPGEWIMRQGEAGQTFYVLLSGEVEVSIQDEQGERHMLGRRRAGEFFGEIALLRHIPRTADVQAVTACHVLVLHQEDFTRLLQNAYAAQVIEHTSTRRLEQLKLQAAH
jgi:putative peptide zinc metalloprotease protein